MKKRLLTSAVKMPGGYGKENTLPSNYSHFRKKEIYFRARAKKYIHFDGEKRFRASSRWNIVEKDIKP